MRRILAVGLFLLVSSCASYTSKTRSGMEAFERRDFSSAENIYAPGAAEDGKDQLVYLFEAGTVRHTAKYYEQSVKDFLLADKLSEIKDYTALATEIATIITNDRITQYKGEEFEHVLVSAFLAINYAMMGKSEDAIVECKRVNRKLERLRSEGKRKYELNAFAQYLSGVLYEKEGNWNSAYIDYKKTNEIHSFSRLQRDLIRGAIEIDYSADMNKWKRSFGVDENDIREETKNLKQNGSVVLLYENGFAPEKVVSSAWYELPEYRKRYNKHTAAHLYLDGKEVARSEILFDVESAAIENLKQKFALLIAKRAAGVVAREVIGNEIDKHQAGLGTMVKIAMYAASQPDLRSWLTLPKDFQVARANIKPGKYHATLRLENAFGAQEDEKDLGEIEVRRPKDVVLLNYRSLND